MRKGQRRIYRIVSRNYMPANVGQHTFDSTESQMDTSFSALTFFLLRASHSYVRRPTEALVISVLHFAFHISPSIRWNEREYPWPELTRLNVWSAYVCVICIKCLWFRLRITARNWCGCCLMLSSHKHVYLELVLCFRYLLLLTERMAEKLISQTLDAIILTQPY